MFLKYFTWWVFIKKRISHGRERDAVNDVRLVILIEFFKDVAVLIPISLFSTSYALS